MVLMNEYKALEGLGRGTGSCHFALRMSSGMVND